MSIGLPAALQDLAFGNADNKVRIAREGGIGPLIALVRDGSAKGKTNAEKRCGISLLVMQTTGFTSGGRAALVR